MLWAACTLGFFGFMRSGEFTATGHTHCPLRASDIRVDSRTYPSLITVHLRQSKTDPFGAGVTIYLGRSGDRICPVTAMLAYLALRPRGNGPLFVHQDGSPLTRTLLVASVREALAGFGLPSASFSGHSFRISAATSAARAGLSDSMIQTLSRWQSSAFCTYIRAPVNTLVSVPQSLVSHAPLGIP